MSFGGGGGGSVPVSPVEEFLAKAGTQAREFYRNNLRGFEGKFAKRAFGYGGDVIQAEGNASINSRNSDEGITSGAIHGDLGSMIEAVLGGRATSAAEAIRAGQGARAKREQGKLAAANMYLGLGTGALGGLNSALRMANNTNAITAKMDAQEDEDRMDVLGTVLGAGTNYGYSKLFSPTTALSTSGTTNPLADPY